MATIIKPVETDTIVKDSRDDFEKHISYSYTYIDSVIEVNDKSYSKKVKPILSHFNYVHCGVGILNMSKRIMNKVFSCAGGCDIKIYYQDTDSIHLNYEDVVKIENGYKEQYGSELVGEELGNFHIDFSMDNANTEIYAIGSLFVGKGTYIYIYIYILESIDKYGKAINSEHIRMKGIPTPCIKYFAEQHVTTVVDVYTKLFNNKTIKFDLINNNIKFVCRNNKDHAIPNVSDFTRKCQYIRYESDKFFIS